MLWVRCCSSSLTFLGSWLCSVSLHHQSLTRAQPHNTCDWKRESVSSYRRHHQFTIRAEWSDYTHYHNVLCYQLLVSDASSAQCSLVTRDGGRARAGDTSHIVTAAQSTSGYNWPGTTTWRLVNCDTQHERASWGNQYITPWKVRIEHGQSLDIITTYKIIRRKSTVRLSKSNLILDICRDRREQEQRERDRLDKERAEREKRDREERDRRERERVERERAKMREIEVQKERERQAVQAMEDVNRHFELSMELAKKVSCPVQIVNDGDGSLNDS